MSTRFLGPHPGASAPQTTKSYNKNHQFIIDIPHRYKHLLLLSHKQLSKKIYIVRKF